ncbi:hypothetical protein [Bradyrhizobium sp. B120]|uniref:hypothetical protein n=1 Tax=Bradyrhizobium sp. B120 TaxID=3410088 RepID=UPI003B97E756
MIVDLVDASGKKDRQKFGEAGLSEIASTIEIPSPQLVGGRKACLVLPEGALQSARNRPQL